MARRNSDRWVTPAVVCTGLLVAGLVVLAVIAAMTYLAARGVDAAPLVDLVTRVVTAIGALGSLLLTLTGRATTAKTERGVGLLASGVGQVVEELDATRGRHAPVLEDEPVPLDPATRPHPFAGRSAAPAAEGR